MRILRTSILVSSNSRIDLSPAERQTFSVGPFFIDGGTMHLTGTFEIRTERFISYVVTEHGIIKDGAGMFQFMVGKHLEVLKEWLRNRFAKYTIYELD